MRLKGIVAVALTLVVVVAGCGGGKAKPEPPAPLPTSIEVPSGSMLPTLKVGQRLSINSKGTPKVGDIVVFYAPEGADHARCSRARLVGHPCAAVAEGKTDDLFVERIVAEPGENIALRSGKAFVDGDGRPEPFARGCVSKGCNFTQPVDVPDGTFYVLGDNRAKANDSRYWGPLPAANIVGRVSG